MASLKPFRSTTIEGAFLEVAFLLEKGEIHLNQSLGGLSEETIEKQAFIQIILDTNEQRIVVTATVPITIESNSFGGYLLAKEFVKDEDVYVA